MAILQCAPCNGLNLPRGAAAIFLYDARNNKLNPLAKRLRQSQPLSQVAEITIPPPKEKTKDQNYVKLIVLGGHFVYHITTSYLICLNILD